jgi:DNA-binding CsgD family transcriptional regulator
MTMNGADLLALDDRQLTMLLEAATAVVNVRQQLALLDLDALSLIPSGTTPARPNGAAHDGSGGGGGDQRRNNDPPPPRGAAPHPPQARRPPEPGQLIQRQAQAAAAREAELVELLRTNPKASQHELARTMGSSQATISGHLHRLQKRGVIARGETGWTIATPA